MLQTPDLMQISHESALEQDINIEVVGVGLASKDWDFRSFSAGTGPNPADPPRYLTIFVIFSTNVGSLRPACE